MQLQPSHYPWYGITSGPDIEQGDIFEDCSLFDPETTQLDDPASRAFFTWQTRDVIVMTQSCDLVPGRVKVDQVLVCILWKLSDFPPNHVLATPKGREEARRGNFPGFHVLAQNQDDDFPREARLVDFRKTRSLPIQYIHQKANKLHLRLLPPYREHLSQSLRPIIHACRAPIDIPPFR